MTQPEEEYLRRNLMVAKAVGVKASASRTLKRLEQQSNPPRWLLLALRGILERADPLPSELKLWRDAARAEKETSFDGDAVGKDLEALARGYRKAEFESGVELCSDCPPADYPTDATRCAECPRMETAAKGEEVR